MKTREKSETEQEAKKVIKLRSITKRFGSILANDNINFDLLEGEIHAILGENGAGKSTLMNVLYGLYRPDQGEIIVHGKKVNFNSPRDAIKLGIGMIHQHFMLIPSLTVLDNVMLGINTFFLRRQQTKEKLQGLCDQLKFHIDISSLVSQLSVGQRQQVEIIRVLFYGARILILDEPTSVLTPQESEKLFEMLKSLKNEGYSVIFISHKLKEALTISDRITILRKGKVITTLKNEQLSLKELARLMVSDNINIAPVRIEHKLSHETRKKTLLRVEKINVRNDKGLLAVREASLTISSGEIVGIAGVSGNGQLELAEAIAGLRKVESGVIYWNDKTGLSVRDLIRIGVAYVPEDRTNVGLAQNLSIYENILLKCYDEFNFLKIDQIKIYALRLVRSYRIFYMNMSMPVSQLSGGNQQRLILARELRKTPLILIASYPTRGLDLESSRFVRQAIMDCRNKGSAILLISEEIEELLEMSDRIVVMFEGQIIDIPDKSIDAIGLAMTGGRP